MRAKNRKCCLSIDSASQSLLIESQQALGNSMTLMQFHADCYFDFLSIFNNDIASAKLSNCSRENKDINNVPALVHIYTGQEGHV